MMKARASGDILMEMETVDPDSFVDHFSKVEILETEKMEMETPDTLETEKIEMESLDLNETDDEQSDDEPSDEAMKMWKALREGRGDEEEDDVKDEDNTCCYDPIAIHFCEEKLSEKYLNLFWETKVEPLFKHHDLSCNLNWPEHKMIVAKKTPFVRSENLHKGACALALLSCPNLPPEWFEQILSGEVHCQYIDLTIPDDLRHLVVSQDDFSSKYPTFRKQVAKSGLLEKLSCSVIYAAEAIFVYSTEPRSIYKMGNLVNWCLLDNGPCEQTIFQLLDDEDDDGGRCAQQKLGSPSVSYYEMLQADCKDLQMKLDLSVLKYQKMWAELEGLMSLQLKRAHHEAAGSTNETDHC